MSQSEKGMGEGKGERENTRWRARERARDGGREGGNREEGSIGGGERGREEGTEGGRKEGKDGGEGAREREREERVRKGGGREEEKREGHGERETHTQRERQKERKRECESDASVTQINDEKHQLPHRTRPRSNNPQQCHIQRSIGRSRQSRRSQTTPNTAGSTFTSRTTQNELVFNCSKHMAMQQQPNSNANSTNCLELAVFVVRGGGYKDSVVHRAEATCLLLRNFLLRRFLQRTAQQNNTHTCT